MTEYELLEMLLDYENSGIEYGQYIITGMFAYILTMFFIGHRITGILVILISTIYSIYVFLLAGAVFLAFYRASVLAGSYDGGIYASDPILKDGSEGLFIGGVALVIFWLMAYVGSIVFVLLVRAKRFVSPDA